VGRVLAVQVSPLVEKIADDITGILAWGGKKASFASIGWDLLTGDMAGLQQQMLGRMGEDAGGTNPVGMIDPEAVEKATAKIGELDSQLRQFWMTSREKVLDDMRTDMEAAGMAASDMAAKLAEAAERMDRMTGFEQMKKGLEAMLARQEDAVKLAKDWAGQIQQIENGTTNRQRA
ncbi:MAG: hypothetical protein KJZ78_23295, partial [Bryobacteraceae bacterium]|nr:hypothetical protein [Bryobacteraceae bacterium]